MKSFALHPKVAVALRYVGAMTGIALTIVGLLGWLDADQIAALKNSVPDFAEALGAAVSIAITTYAIFNKNSAKALKVADAVDKVEAHVAPVLAVEVVTPPGTDNVRVPVAPLRGADQNIR